MSVLKSMYAAASGLLAHSEAISVASDNIANVNTVGFKTQRARFEDVLGSTVAGAVENQSSGQGVRLGGVHSLFTQGSLIASRLNTDMAIQGDGFFVLRGGYDGLQDGKFFTRQGQFNIDNEGFLSNYKGLRVQGYTADKNGNLKSTLSFHRHRCMMFCLLLMFSKLNAKSLNDLLWRRCFLLVIFQLLLWSFFYYFILTHY